MPSPTFTDKEALKKLNKSWKKAVLAKHKRLPKAQKLVETASWASAIFKLLLIALFLGFTAKVAGKNLSSEAHFSGLVILFSIYGTLLLGASQAYFCNFIPSPLIHTPLSSELLLRSKKPTFYKLCFIIASLFIGLSFLHLSDHSKWHSSITLGLLILLTSTATSFLLSFFLNPFKLTMLAGISLVILFFISFYPSAQEYIYSPFKPLLQCTPVGLVISRNFQHGITLPTWSYTLLALASLIIIQRYYQLLFNGFAIDREQQEITEQYIAEEELENESPAISELSNKKSSTPCQENLSVQQYLDISGKEQTDYLGQRFYQLLSAREKSILSLSETKTLFSPLWKSIVALIAAIFIPMIDQYMIYDIPRFFHLAPLFILATYSLTSNGVALALFENQFTAYKTPRIGYYPVTYKEVIRLHLKEIACSTIWKFPLFLAALAIYRHYAQEPFVLTFAHVLLALILYFTGNFLAIYKYKQTPNIISKHLGVRFLDIILLFVFGIVALSCVFIFGYVIKDYHPALLYYLSAGCSIFLGLLAYIHYKSYMSMKLDIIQKTKL